MRLHRQSTSTSGPRRIVVRLLLAALAAALTLVATPGPASAATTSTVTPFFDCYVDNGNSTYKVVLGYTNTSRSSVTYSSGSTSNTFSPTSYNGVQTTTFKSGTYHGAFYVTITSADAPYFSWTLGATTITYAGAISTASPCAAGTTMPATGNGTGAAIVLVAAGLVGVLLVRRIVRRAATPAQVA